MAVSHRMYLRLWSPSLRRAAADTFFAFIWHGTNLSLLLPVFMGLGDGASLENSLAQAFTTLVVCLLIEILALLFTFSSAFRRWWALLAERIERRGFILAIGALLLNIWLWSMFERHPLLPVFLTFNLFMIAGLTAKQPPPAKDRYWIGLWIILLIALCILGLVSAYQYPEEHPGLDEVGWTAYAVNYLNTGHIYYRLLGSASYPITPGIGWWVVIYATWIQIFGISMASARSFMLVVYLLGITLTGWAGKRLYGPRASWIAAIIFAGSAYVVQFRWLRPELLMTLVVALFLVLYSAKQRRPLAHFAAGLVAVLSMEIHGSGVAVMASVGLLYATDFLGDVLAGRRPSWSVYWSAAAGALVGAMWFLVTHILILGDPHLYFELLAARQVLSGSRLMQIFWLWWNFSAASQLEALLLIPSALALLLCRERADWLLLRLMAFFVLMYTLLVPLADRYWVGWMPLPVLAFTALLVNGFQRRKQTSPLGSIHPFWQSVVVMGMVMLVVIRSATSAAFSDPFPAFTIHPRDERIRAVVTDRQAVVVGDLESYWAMLDYPNFYVTASEGEARFYPDRQASPYGVWSVLDPDVVTLSDNPDFPLELDKLMLYLSDYEFHLVDEFVIEGLVTRIWFRKDYQSPEDETQTTRSSSRYRSGVG